MPDRFGYRGIERAAAGDLRVLVVDTEDHGRQHTVKVLRERGCDCQVVAADDNAVQTASDYRPDVIVLDSCVLARSGSELLRWLKADHRTALVPVICVAADGGSEAVLELLAAGADDYVAKPFDADELLARIVGAARRRALLGGINPLTGLPGNLMLTRELQARIDDGEGFAFLHVDLDNFKAFNDRYGFVRGDRVIADTAQLLHTSVERVGVTAAIGHIGGDDFGIVTTVEAAAPLADEIARAFDEVAPASYDDSDRERGWILVEGRDGRTTSVPLLSVSIGVTLWAAGRPRSPVAVADAAAEMKGLAKRHAGSYVAVDRRGA